MIQTASGSLNQINSILQTMNTLALSSANSATTDTEATNANNDEFQALAEQINQIAQTTTFGTTNLLDGSFLSGQTLQVGASASSGNQVNLSIGGATTGALGIPTTALSGTLLQVTTTGLSLIPYSTQGISLSSAADAHNW